MTNDEKRTEALKQIKAVYDDQLAEINGRKYKFTVMSFNERRAVFAYMTSIEHRIKSGDFSFLDEVKYKDIETNYLFKRVTVDDMTLSKKNVFEEFPEDYISFVNTALMVISYPFLKGQLGG